MRRGLLRFRRDERGVTVIEFAFVAPVMLLLLMGLCDLAYQCYVQAMLTGAMQKAGRDSTIQGNGAKTSQIDAKVMSWVRSVAANATYVSTRKNYDTFGQIKAEEFIDANINGVPPNGVYDRDFECFFDTNNNRTRDLDPGEDGQGGANDIVLYKMTVTYPRLFPLYGMLGWSANQQVSATTILKNQPWAAQNAHTVKKVCP